MWVALISWSASKNISDARVVHTTRCLRYLNVLIISRRSVWAAAEDANKLPNPVGIKGIITNHDQSRMMIAPVLCLWIPSMGGIQHRWPQNLKYVYVSWWGITGSMGSKSKGHVSRYNFLICNFRIYLTSYLRNKMPRFPNKCIDYITQVSLSSGWGRQSTLSPVGMKGIKGIIANLSVMNSPEWRSHPSFVFVYLVWVAPNIDDRTCSTYTLTDGVSECTASNVEVEETCESP